MKVSFIVTVYKVAEYLPQCIESIIAQSITDFEVILVDDGSPDNCGKICDSYCNLDKRITVIHQKNQGVSIARNNGMKQARGEWICFIDGDDIIAPNLIFLYSDFLNSHYDICFIKHQEVRNEKMFDIISEDAENTMNVENNAISFEENDFQEFQYAAFNRDRKNSYDFHLIKPATPCKLYRRDFVQENGITFPERIPTGEDSIFNLYCYRHAKKGAFIDIPVYFHRVWRGSVSKKYNPNAKDDFVLLNSYYKKFINSDINPERFRQVYYERCVWSFGFCCLLDYCHVNNPNRYKKRKETFLNNLSGEFSKSFNMVNLSAFRIQKSLLFWLIKKKLFCVVSILCFLERLRD